MLVATYSVNYPSLRVTCSDHASIIPSNCIYLFTAINIHTIQGVKLKPTKRTIMQHFIDNC